MTEIQAFDTVVFDVLGTVVDERGSIQDEVAETVAGNGHSEHSTCADLSEKWTTELDRAVGDIGAGRAAWESNDVLRRRTLEAALSDFPTVHLKGTDRDRLGGVGHRLRPWPDSALALADLRVWYKVAALSNADLAQLANFSAAGGLSWHCVLSGSLVGSVKPDPAVYQLAIRQLQADPHRTLFVACHPWDLRAAALQGFRTAYVHRPGEALPAESDHFDVLAADLADLADQLVPSH